MIWDRVMTAATWVYDNGSLVLGVGTFIAFTYFCWTRKLKGMLISSAALITSLVLGW